MAGGFIFKDMDGIIYGMIINYFFAIVVDKVMYGINAGKLTLIVTDLGEEVTDVIEECCGRGSTILNGLGGYKKEEKQVVMCACNNKQMYILEKAVKEVDPNSFMIIMESNEVVGEGFKRTRIAEVS